MAQSHGALICDHHLRKTEARPPDVRGTAIAILLAVSLSRSTACTTAATCCPVSWSSMKRAMPSASDSACQSLAKRRGADRTQISKAFKTEQSFGRVFDVGAGVRKALEQAQASEPFFKAPCVVGKVLLVRGACVNELPAPDDRRSPIRSDHAEVRENL